MCGLLTLVPVNYDGFVVVVCELIDFTILWSIRLYLSMTCNSHVVIESDVDCSCVSESVEFNLLRVTVMYLSKY